MSILASVAGAVRPNFLVLTPVCVLLGVAVAIHDAGHVDLGDALIALLGAGLAHMAVNLLNEYLDFRSGLDALTVRTPYSGGSGALPAHPEAAPAALAGAIAGIAGTVLVGLYFTALRGVAIVPLGVLGLAIVLSYTHWITRHPLLCLLAPGLGFGTLMVMGTAFVLTGTYTATAAWASMVPLLLTSELLLIHQIPDIDADRAVGRRHLPTAIGPRASAVIYALLLLAAYAAVAGSIVLAGFPGTAALALLPLPAAVVLAREAVARARDRARLVAIFGANVAVILSTIALYALGLLAG